MVVLFLVAVAVIAYQHKAQNGRQGTPGLCCSAVMLLVAVVVRAFPHKAWHSR